MHVLFFAPHFPSYQRYFAKALKELGVRVSCIGDWDFYRLDEELRSWIDWYEQVPDMHGVEPIVAAAKKIHAMVPVDRVETTIEAQMIPATKAREAVGAPGMSLELVDTCRDKTKMKRVLSAAGIPVAKFAAVDSEKDAREFVKSVGYPVILKPRDAAGAYDTHRVDSDEQLEVVLKKMEIDAKKRSVAIEEFITGHEGFYDTMTVNGEIVFEAVSHYYPNVLEAMRTRWISPQIVTTNRLYYDSYKPLIELGRKTIKALGIQTAATHMEWFYSDKGLVVSEIGARPAGVRFWEIYCWANDCDLFHEWARAICFGESNPQASRRYSMGLISIRPSQDGIVSGYSGVEEVKARCGEWLCQLVLPAVGEKTQGVEYGYNAHAYAWVRHPDYDECRNMLNYIGETMKMWAR